ncbi:hypothetical protein [Streptomyces chartreusis]
MRLKAGAAAAAAMLATGGLIAAAPSASAAGNCNNYGRAGYAQMFTGANYTGDCFEWVIGQYTRVPSYMTWKNVSVRSWAAYYNQQLTVANETYNLHETLYAGNNWPNGMGSVTNRAEAAW